VGKYRVIYRVVTDESVIIVQTVELRKKAYDQ